MRRATAEEQMDAPDLPADTYAAVLADLARVNRVTMAARPTLRFLARATRPGDRFTLLDVGFGQGDMLRAIRRWARSTARDAVLTGVDLNPGSAIASAGVTPAEDAITFVTGDYAEQGPFDLIVSSLVAHHMTRDQLIAFLRHMEAEARLGWFVNDLHRHRLAWLGYPLLARLMGWHRIVREDGRLSIARAFTPGEWRALLDEAGIADARVFRAFPFRLCVERRR